MLAAEEINEAGGLEIGDDRYLIDVTMYDDRMILDEAVANVKRLITLDKVKYIFPPTPSSNGMAFMPWIEKHIEETGEDIVVMFDGEGATELTERWGGTIGFRERLTSYYEGAAEAGFLVDYIGAKTVGTIVSREEYGFSVQQGFRDAFEAAGGKIVSEQWYSYGDIDFRPQLTGIMDKNPDAILIGHHPEYCMDIANQAIDLGYKEAGIHITLVSSESEDLMRDTIGAERGEGITVGYASSYPYFLGKEDPLIVEFMEKIRLRFAEPIGDGHPCGYMAARILARAMEIADSVDPTEVKKALRKLKVEDIEDFSKICPCLPVDEAGHIYDDKGQAVSAYCAMEFTGGELVPISLMLPPGVEFPE